MQFATLKPFRYGQSMRYRVLATEVHRVIHRAHRVIHRYKRRYMLVRVATQDTVHLYPLHREIYEVLTLKY